jgi:DNA modification methylase
MPDNFLDCVITSPPYWQLRDYGYEGQWGLEPTFQEYLEHLWSLMDAIYPKLKDSGTVWVNLGDTYSTQSGSNLGIYRGTHRIASGNLVKGKSMPGKCLLLIPHRFAIGCEDRGWIVRNDIIWAKRNGMPESVTDRFSKKHEYFFFMVKKEKYYFDLDAIKDKIENKGKPRVFGKSGNPRSDTGRIYNPEKNDKKNPGDVSDFWDIPTKPNKLNHYATYNESLISKPILAGCPEGGIIYDPFMGIGTTAICAIRSNRKFIGSEMSKEYCNIANKNIEPYLLQKTIF